MQLTSIFILTGIAFIISWIKNQEWREWGLVTISIILMFWLQPDMPVKYLGFWLPFVTLMIVILSWRITKADTQNITQEHETEQRDTIKTLAVSSLLVLLLSSTRYFNLRWIETPYNLPKITSVLICILVLIFIWVALSRSEKLKNVSAYLFIAIILLFLVVIKNSQVSFLVSGWLRKLAGQSSNMDPSLTYIRWLGFSYVAFRIIHTIRDRQSGRLPDVTLREYIIYVLFFPAFTAGPIDKIQRFVKDLRREHQVTSERMIEAGQRIIVGLFKKFVLADTLALISISNQNVVRVDSSFWMWIFVYAYAFQIYLDFSGYTDIAIGIGKILGIDLPENFNKPYRQRNITQFWNNWHITLTQWFRAYFFFPLTRKLRKSRINIPAGLVLFVTQISTMVLIGMWHGITINFITWGLWQGIGLFVHNQWSDYMKSHGQFLESKPALQSGLAVFSTLFTFHYIASGWVWFAITDFHISTFVLLKLLGI